MADRVDIGATSCWDWSNQEWERKLRTVSIYSSIISQSRLIIVSSLQELQSKVTDLESETDRLSSALEAQKAAASDTLAASTKKVEDISKELQRRVWSFSTWRSCPVSDHTSNRQAKLINWSKNSSSILTMTKSSASWRSWKWENPLHAFTPALLILI